ncbi:unnamed protein product [Zymoseptoria tritici ST99CH_1A5]|uniref:Uncharacterized protein n=3 Tax=Zymoseptoria TaxID=1047167 RepID=A0A0F4GC39_9PEZI|nr:hypothetical protein TI39_contig4147g00002 [Zymoseptoria brevis]SMR48580.1 unnamed protein product [Zymoseptoria tritici ST99CH_1E4]SMR49761.1 unnamed protein product [Zymoseptoria tritici ST99CH_3D1]SMY22459.1 unnamed protein product [Zymoseptoria tritici ST99CH_1A5]
MSDTSLSAQVNKLNINDSASNPDSTPPSEIVGLVDDMLNQLNSKFNAVSSEILSKMDAMSKRLDSLESNIAAGNAAAAAAAGKKEGE